MSGLEGVSITPELIEELKKKAAILRMESRTYMEAALKAEETYVRHQFHQRNIKEGARIYIELLGQHGVEEGVFKDFEVWGNGLYIVYFPLTKKKKPAKRTESLPASVCKNVYRRIS